MVQYSTLQYTHEVHTQRLMEGGVAHCHSLASQYSVQHPDQGREDDYTLEKLMVSHQCTFHIQGKP